MASPLKLGNLWRVISDVDLHAIRTSSVARFRLAFVSDDVADAQRAAALLSAGPEALPHPWCEIFDATDPARVTAGTLVAVLVARDASLGEALVRVREHCVRINVPVVALIVGAPQATNDAPRLGEAARIHTGALDDEAARRLAAAIHGAAPADARLSLATTLPAMRPVASEALIEETARANASFALTTGLAETIPVLTAPLNLGDIVVLTKNQLILSYRIALMHGHGRDGDPRSLMTEILGVLGGGLLFRQAARQLVGLIPVVGIVPKVAIAYGGTWAIGRAMTAWAADGRAVTADAVRRYSAEGLERGRAVARRLIDGAQHAGSGARQRWDRFRREIPFLRRK